MRWYIKEQMDDKDLVGLSVALVDDQKIVWSEGFGYADKEKGIKATPQTRYRAGSITKLFTDMAVMKLVEEGKMDIDKPFKTYLPEFSIKSRFGSTDNITPRNIMTHHSGIPGGWGNSEFGNNPLPFRAYVYKIQNEYVAYAPNTIMSYSNLALTLLGHSVEKVSGMAYEKYVDKILFSPMEMNHADLKMVLSGDNESKSYEERKEKIEYADGLIPAGALNISVTELAHLAMMINANGTYKNHRILQSSTLHKMFTVQNKNVKLDIGKEIGLGYFIDSTLLGKKDKVYHHGGAVISQNAFFCVSPHSKLGVVVMSNNAGRDARDIAEKLLQKTWEAKTGKKDTIYSHGGAVLAQNAYFCVSPHSKLGVVVMSNNAGIDAMDIAKKLLQKAWEAKTEKKVEKEKEKHSVTHASDFSGVYVTVVGRVTFTKNSNDDYTANTDDGTFKLYKTKDNLYKLKYKLLGLLPISKDELDEVELYTDEIEGHHVIIAFRKGNKFVAGVKVEKPKYIPDAWKKYVGHYKVLNNFEVEE
ncbi:MAG: beta-lactamase family protein, partial [Sulfurovum sp.]|nr:beta-lactamase family protein [Sulfurovum sp.]